MKLFVNHLKCQNQRYARSRTIIICRSLFGIEVSWWHSLATCGGYRSVQTRLCFIGGLMVCCSFVWGLLSALTICQYLVRRDRIFGGPVRKWRHFQTSEEDVSRQNVRPFWTKILRLPTWRAQKCSVRLYEYAYVQRPLHMEVNIKDSIYSKVDYSLKFENWASIHTIYNQFKCVSSPCYPDSSEASCC